MIFYFTGTGNSLYAAYRIAEAQNMPFYSIADMMESKTGTYRLEMEENGFIGFVFPVYAWGPPKIVLDFIEKLNIVTKSNTAAKKDADGKPYIFYISTCGGEEGCTGKMIKNALARKSLVLDSTFSIRMPNNYIIGADVESEETNDEILKNAELLICDINKSIEQRRRSIDLSLPGRFPTLKTSLINPLFNRFALNTKYFSVDDNCTSCGICEKICPVHTIKINDSGRPAWNDGCTQCLGCLHRCPAHAVQYGKRSAKKGRYHHPDIDRLENKAAKYKEV